MYRAWFAFALACLCGAGTVVVGVIGTTAPPLLFLAVGLGGTAVGLYRYARDRMVEEAYERVGAERNPDGTVGDPGAAAERHATGRVEYEPRDDWDDPEDWPFDDPFWTEEEPFDEGVGPADATDDPHGRGPSASDRGTWGGGPPGDGATGGAVTVDPRTRQACEVLGVDPDASPEAIRGAYRERVLETHPDHGGDREAFERVRWAYEHLEERYDE